MSPLEIAALLALIGYAIYRQSIQHEVVGHSRFKLAIIYGIVGVAIGGFSRPNGAREIGLLVASIALSVIVGWGRGRLTPIWRDRDGRIYSQGTRVTIGLFLAMVVIKFAMGTWAYFAHVSDDGGFGEVMLMIAVMIAFQAQIIWRRAQALDGHRARPVAVGARS
jgi:hypothetical protein